MRLKCRFVCHRPDGLEDSLFFEPSITPVCHRPDGLEAVKGQSISKNRVCHRPDGLEDQE